MIPRHRTRCLRDLQAACIIVAFMLAGYASADALGNPDDLPRNWKGENLHGRLADEDSNADDGNVKPGTGGWSVIQKTTPVIVGLSLLILFGIFVFYWKRKSLVARGDKISFIRHIRKIFSSGAPRVQPEGRDEAWTIDSTNTDSLYHSYVMVSHPDTENSPLHLQSRWSPSIPATPRFFRRFNPHSASGSTAETRFPGRTTFRNMSAIVKDALPWRRTPPTVVTSRLGPESTFDIFTAESDPQKSSQTVKWPGKGNKFSGYDAISQEHDMDEDPRSEGHEGGSGLHSISNVGRHHRRTSPALSVDKETLADTVLLIRGDNPDFTIESASTEHGHGVNGNHNRKDQNTTLTSPNVHIIPASPSTQSFHHSAPVPPSPAPPPLLPPVPRQPAPLPPSSNRGHLHHASSSSKQRPGLRSAKSPSRTPPDSSRSTNRSHSPSRPLHHQQSEISVDQLSILGTPRQSQYFEKPSSANLAPVTAYETGPASHASGSAQRPGNILLQPNRHPDAYIPHQHSRSASNLSFQSADHFNGAFHQRGWTADDDRASIMMQKNPMELDDTNAYLTTTQDRRHDRNLSSESFMSAGSAQNEPDKRTYHNTNGRRDMHPLSTGERYQATFAGRESISESSGWESHTQHTEEMGHRTSPPPMRPGGSGERAFAPSRNDTVMLFPGSVRGAGYTLSSQRNAPPIPSSSTTNAQRDHDARSHVWSQTESYGYGDSGETSPGGRTWETESSGMVSAFQLQQPPNAYVKSKPIKRT